MIESHIHYSAADNAWVVSLRVDASDEYDFRIDAEACRTAGQALDAALSMF